MGGRIVRLIPYPEMKVVRPTETGDTQFEDLVQTCLSQLNCARLLRFFANNPSTVMTSVDLAATVGCCAGEIETAFEVLERFDLLRHVVVGNLQFFGLAESDEARDLAQNFRLWCQAKQDRWRAVERLVACA
jgi:hypothetical protein